MGDSRGADPTSYVLPPGCRFFPSDEQLLCYYLTRKNSTESEDADSRGCDVIKELDFYSYDPFDLPGFACYSYGYKGQRKHWYCYALVRMVKESSRGGRRTTRAGFWRKKGRARDVCGENGGNVVLGTRTKFVFYLGNSAKTTTRTDWVMYEYALIGSVKASFVLCRVFANSHGRNCLSENGLSCGDGSVSTVRHVGIQHDGVSTSDSLKSRGHSDHSAEGNNHQSRCQDRILSEQEEQAVITPNSFNLGLQSGIQSKELVRLSDITSKDEMYNRAAADRDLLSIMEEDFIELNDLICPLSGTDSLR